MKNLLRCLLATATLCGAFSSQVAASASRNESLTAADPGFTSQVKASFSLPWAIDVLPNGRMLISERSGKLKLFTPGSNAVKEVRGVPKVVVGGQGGLGDILVPPDWGKKDHWVYFSYVEPSANGSKRGAVVARAVLSLYSDGTGALSNTRIIWRQPKEGGMNQYSSRLAFSPNGEYLFITSGDRSLMDPAQDKYSNLGKVVRLRPDGSVPTDNPFYGQGEMASQVWTMGHRNVLGIAFAKDGRLWITEMGPKGGDEFNLIVKGRNYGWPLVSEGDHYDGTPIPRHRTRPEFFAPKVAWTPVIAPAGMLFYSGSKFPSWRGDALIAGLKSKSIVRVRIQDGINAREVARYKMQNRIRDLAQTSDGAIWVLEDQLDGQGGRLLKLIPN